jgi:hypothetical protein
MTRFVLLLLVGLMGIACFETVEVLGASSKNPFSGYNVSGVNYGAQQWDREHGGKSSAQHPKRYRRR